MKSPTPEKNQENVQTEQKDKKILYTDLQKKFGVNVFIALVALISFLSTNSYLKNLKDEKISRANSLLIQVSTAQNDLAVLERNIKEFEESKKLWQKIKEQNSKRNGLDFDLARTVINGVNKSKFLSSSIDINIAPPSINLNDPNYRVGIESAEVDVKFKNMSDILSFGILGKITSNFEGFVTFKYLKIGRITELNPQLIESLKRGIYPEIIECSAQFTWQNLKDIKK
ncbi:MAG: hypothetical protein J0H68_06845 [Sphingobacteriia bacterium]|nr:hypothetical protein [Sphingobacteriia bacterium]